MDFVCPFGCLTRTSRYFIDARKWKAGRICSDTRGRVFQSYDHAYRQLETMRREVDNHTFDPSRWIPAKMREYRFGAEVGKWIEHLHRQRSNAYWVSVRNTMRRVLPVFEVEDVRDIRKAHLADFLAGLDGMLAPSSIKTMRDHLASFFSWLGDREDIKEIPNLPAIEVPFRESGWITREAQIDIVERINPRHRLLFETLIGTGCRPGEIAALRVKHLCDGELLIEQAIDRTGKVKETKSGTVRYKCVAGTLYARLQKHAEGKFPMDFLFTNRYGLPYRSSGMSTIWKEASDAAGIRIALYPGTRHSRASQKRAEMERKMRSELAADLGHSSPVITMKHYARPKGSVVKGGD
jgi:integrase